MNVAVFDLDNTLLDRDRAIRAYLESLGLVGAVLEDMLVRDDRGYSSRLEFCDALSGHTGFLGSGENRAQAQWNHMQARLGSFCERDAGRNELVLSLRPAWNLVILTNGETANQRLKIRHAGWDEVAELIVVAGEVGAWKPNRAAFEACQRWEGARYVMVGDHPEHDIQGAAACGWQTVWLSLGRRWEDVSRGRRPDYEVEDLVQAVRLLHELA